VGYGEGWLGMGLALAKRMPREGKGWHGGCFIKKDARMLGEWGKGWHNRCIIKKDARKWREMWEEGVGRGIALAKRMPGGRWAVSPEVGQGGAMCASQMGVKQETWVGYLGYYGNLTGNLGRL